MLRFIEAVLCVSWSLMAVVFLGVVLGWAASGCSLLNPTTGEEQVGLPTAVTAEVLRGLADDVELWDVNKDGLNTDQELVALGLAATQRLLVAWQQAQVGVGADVDR